MSDGLLFENFPVSRWRLYLTTDTHISQPAYAGSMWRGLFGKALWEMACQQPSVACHECTHLADCAYPRLFEVPGTALPWAGGSRAPTAWLVEPAMPDENDPQRSPGRLYTDFVLIGHAQTFLPLVLMAWQRGLSHGIGANRVVGRVESLWLLEGVETEPTRQCFSPQDGWTVSSNGLVQIPCLPKGLDALTVELQTPLRLKRDNDLVGPREFDPGTFLDALVRRTSLLARVHAGAFPEMNFYEMKSRARALKMEATSLVWQDWTRFSSRQKESMQMGGLRGQFRLIGDLSDFWPFLYIAQWTHVGKGTSFGLGRIHLKLPSSLS